MAPSNCSMCGAFLFEALILECSHDLCLGCAASVVNRSNNVIRCPSCSTETRLESDAVQRLVPSATACHGVTACHAITPVSPCHATSGTSPPSMHRIDDAVGTLSPQQKWHKLPFNQSKLGGAPSPHMNVGCAPPLAPASSSGSCAQLPLCVPAPCMSAPSGSAPCITTICSPVRNPPLGQGPTPKSRICGNYDRICGCHEKLPVSFWCENCCKLICSECAALDTLHKQHRVLPLRMATVHVQSNIENFMSTLKSAADEIRQEKYKLDSAERRVNAHLSTSMAKLRQAVYDAQEKLKYFENNLAKEFDEVVAQTCKEISKQREEVETRLNNVTCQGEQLLTALETLDDTSVLHWYSEAMRTARDIHEYIPRRNEAIPEVGFVSTPLLLRSGTDFIGEFPVLKLARNDTENRAALGNLTAIPRQAAYLSAQREPLISPFRIHAHAGGAVDVAPMHPVGANEVHTANIAMHTHVSGFSYSEEEDEEEDEQINIYARPNFRRFVNANVRPSDLMHNTIDVNDKYATAAARPGATGPRANREFTSVHSRDKSTAVPTKTSTVRSVRTDSLDSAAFYKEALSPRTAANNVHLARLYNAQRDSSTYGGASSDHHTIKRSTAGSCATVERSSGYPTRASTSSSQAYPRHVDALGAAAGSRGEHTSTQAGTERSGAKSAISVWEDVRGGDFVVEMPPLGDSLERVRYPPTYSSGSFFEKWEDHMTFSSGWLKLDEDLFVYRSLEGSLEIAAENYTLRAVELTMTNAHISSKDKHTHASAFSFARSDKKSSHDRPKSIAVENEGKSVTVILGPLEKKYVSTTHVRWPFEMTYTWYFDETPTRELLPPGVIADWEAAKSTMLEYVTSDYPDVRIKECAKHQIPFVDTDFNPYGCRYRFSWYRIHKLINLPVEVCERLAGFNKGGLADVGFLAAVKALKKPHLKRLFETTKYNDIPGTYALNMWFNGSAERVVIDDWVPCVRKIPVLSRGNELWITLLEKAYAKMIGGYNHIENVLPHRVMMDLTGSPGEAFYFDRMNDKKLHSKFFSLVISWFQQGFPLVLAAKQFPYLTTGYYVVSNAKVLDEYPHKLLRVDNEWAIPNASTRHPFIKKERLAELYCEPGLWFDEKQFFVHFDAAFVCYDFIEKPWSCTQVNLTYQSLVFRIHEPIAKSGYLSVFGCACAIYASDVPDPRNRPETFLTEVARLSCGWPAVYPIRFEASSYTVYLFGPKANVALHTHERALSFISPAHVFHSSCVLSSIRAGRCMALENVKMYVNSFPGGDLGFYAEGHARVSVAFEGDEENIVLIPHDPPRIVQVDPEIPIVRFSVRAEY